MAGEISTALNVLIIPQIPFKQNTLRKSGIEYLPAQVSDTTMLHQISNAGNQKNFLQLPNFLAYVLARSFFHRFYKIIGDKNLFGG